MAHIVYIQLDKITNNIEKTIGDFRVDPDISLPLELSPDNESWSPKDLKWEAIISAMLKILAYRSDAENAGYYRDFIKAVKPNIKDELTESGIIKAKNGDFEIAVELFQALSGLFPQCAATRLNLALVYEQQARSYEAHGEMHLAEQNYAAAFHQYKEALLKDPHIAEIHYNFAYFYLHQKNFTKAEAHFIEFLENSADTQRNEKVTTVIAALRSQNATENLFKEAFDAIKTGQEEKGIDKISEYLKTHNDVWNAWFLYGWGCRRLGRFAEGKSAFQRALRLNQNHADILNELAICLMELGEFEKSYNHLKKANEIDPDNIKILSNLGILELKRGADKEAIAYFQKVLRIDEHDPLANQYLNTLT